MEGPFFVGRLFGRFGPAAALFGGDALRDDAADEDRPLVARQHHRGLGHERPLHLYQNCITWPAKCAGQRFGLAAG
jgi:hypothetical protein